MNNNSVKNQDNKAENIVAMGLFEYGAYKNKNGKEKVARWLSGGQYGKLVKMGGSRIKDGYSVAGLLRSISKTELVSCCLLGVFSFFGKVFDYYAYFLGIEMSGFSAAVLTLAFWIVTGTVSYAFIRGYAEKIMLFEEIRNILMDKYVFDSEK